MTQIQTNKQNNNKNDCIQQYLLPDKHIFMCSTRPITRNTSVTKQHERKD